MLDTKLFCKLLLLTCFLLLPTIILGNHPMYPREGFIRLKSGVKLRPSQNFNAKAIAIIPFKAKVQIISSGKINDPDGYGGVIGWRKVSWKNRIGWLPSYSLIGRPYIPPIHPKKYKPVLDFKPSKSDLSRAVKLVKDILESSIRQGIEWANGNPERIDLQGSTDDYYMDHPIVNTMKLYDLCEKKWRKFIIIFLMSRLDKNTYRCYVYERAQKRLVATCGIYPNNFYQELESLRNNMGRYVYLHYSCTLDSSHIVPRKPKEKKSDQKPKYEIN